MRPVQLGPSISVFHTCKSTYFVAASPFLTAAGEEEEEGATGRPDTPSLSECEGHSGPQTEMRQEKNDHRTCAFSGRQVWGTGKTV